MRDYPRLPIVEFGKHLLETGDLDPIYVALADAGFGAVELRRWCLCYWTFYHAGTSCYIAEASSTPKFWRRFERAAANVIATPFGARWPRGHERRHMRGAKAIDCYDHLLFTYPTNPEGFANNCASGPTTCREVMRRVQQHVQFGPWIGFKVADMAERVLGVTVDFDRSEIFMFTDPKKAALLLWRTQSKLHGNAKPRDEAYVLELVVRWLEGEFKGLLAPPRGDRPVGFQEVETVLCKWKSHMNGHYPENNDTIEIRQGLQPWLEHSESAQRFLAAMPEVQPW